MCKHDVDELGYPIDPELSRLERLLCDLAAWWRSEPEKREEIKMEYHATMDKLFSLGWGETSLDVECELPDEHMPPKYFAQF